jgi:nitrite reductase/ring-hydroxylating ferredoxin subunit
VEEMDLTGLTLQDMMEPPSGRSIEDQLLQPAGILATANGHNVVLYYWNETLYCSDEECPHAGGPLNLGDIEEINSNPCITCPWHKFSFRLVDGVLVRPRGGENRHRLNTYPVKILPNGTIAIGFKSFLPYFFTNENF